MKKSFLLVLFVCFALQAMESQLSEHGFVDQQELDYELFEAIIDGDYEAVIEWMAIGANVSVRYDSFCLPWKTIACRPLSLFCYLYRKERLRGYGSPLHTTVVHGDQAMTELLLECGASVNSKDSILKTPLHYAVANSNGGIVSVLLNHGADPNSIDWVGENTLHKAGLNYIHYSDDLDMGIIQMLCCAGANIHQIDSVGSSPLSYADMCGYRNCVGFFENFDKYDASFYTEPTQDMIEIKESVVKLPRIECLKKWYRQVIGKNSKRYFDIVNVLHALSQKDIYQLLDSCDFLKNSKSRKCAWRKIGLPLSSDELKMQSTFLLYNKHKLSDIAITYK
jgi:ankyrin repeat protein